MLHIHLYKRVLSFYNVFFLIKFTKRNNQCFGKGKTIKSYATIPLSISFPWAREGKPQAYSLKHFNTQKCIPLSSLSISQVTHLFQCTQCACGALQSCPLFCIDYTYFPIFFHEFQAFSVTERHKILHHHFSL